MSHLFSRSQARDDGSVVIPAELVNRWQRQIATPYADLSEQEKESDREQARLLLPIIQKES